MVVCTWLKGLNSGQAWSLVFVLCAMFAAFIEAFGLVLVCLVFALVWWFVVSDNYEEEEE
jgi:hypothetical protein